MSRFTRFALLLALVVGSLAATTAPASAIAIPAPVGCWQLGAQAVPGYSCNTYVSTLSYYKGWGSVEYDCNSVDPAFSLFTAWRWTSTGWKAAYLNPGMRVYVWPYATGWSWVWTQNTGWLAFQDRYLVVNRTPCYSAGAAQGARVP